MTDATAGRGGVGIRVFIEGGEVVRRTFNQIGDSGRKMWAEIALGEKSANPAIRGLSRGMGELRDGFDGLISRAGSAGTVMAAFGAAGVLAAAAMGGLAIAATASFESMRNAADLTDTADRIGVGVEALQQWRYVADEAGVSTSALEGGMEKLNGTLGRFKLGIADGRLKPVFEELGITKAQLDNVQSADQLMVLLADRLGQVQDRAQQVALARALGIEELLPILRLGSEELQRLTGAAEDLNLVVGEETVKRLDEADRKFELAGQQMRIMRDTAVAPLASGLAEVTGELAGLASEFSDIEARWPAWMQMFLSLGRAMPNSGAAQRLFEFGVGRAASGLPDGPTFDAQHQIVAPDVAGALALIKGEKKSGFEPQGHTSNSGGSAARNAAREAEQRRQREERAADQLARLRGEMSRTYDRGGMSIDERAAYEVADLEQERAERLREIARQEEQYVRSRGLQGLTEAEAEQLRLAQTELADRKKGIVEWERRRAVEAERLKQEEQAAEAAVTLMDLDAQLTTSRRERVALERRILLATLDIERRRKQAEVDDDNNLTDDMRRRIMGDFEASASRRVRLFDHNESERLREEFKGYGREVVQAIEDGNIGAYIGDQLKQRLLDGALDALFNMFNRGSGAAAGGWASTAVNLVGSLFGGGRAGGGGVRAGFRYDLAEHGRPELLLLGGQGQVTDAAATARMLREAMGPVGGWGGAGGAGTVGETRIIIETNDDRFNAYVDGRVQPAVAASEARAIRTSTTIARKGAASVQQSQRRLGTT